MKILTENVCLLFIDIQEKFSPVISGMDGVLKNTLILAKAVKILEVPFIVTQQYPAGLGQTLPEVLDILKPEDVVDKTAFSCYGESGFVRKLNELNRRNVIIVCGIETHVCVLQTVFDLLSNDYHVMVASDATSSRHIEDKELALSAMRDAGAVVVSTESILFMLLADSKHPHFREVQALVK
ncbi:hydrolase [Candidatus Desantisbacteria bacterium]|nr:hydrolase [Candidatus Desantisbacteria bacterium]